jgi:hypothetical protein
MLEKDGTVRGETERIIDEMIIYAKMAYNVEKVTARRDKKPEWLFVPFRGAEMLVEVRYPQSTQLPDIDKLYRIAGGVGKGEGITRLQIIDIMNIQEQCCRAVLNRPTFEELERAVYGKDRVSETNRKRIEEMRLKLEKVNGPEKRGLQSEIDRLELFNGYILPADTMLALTKIAAGADVSDIEKTTGEKLLTAYGKAVFYKQRPSDFIPGIFTDGDRKKIDNYVMRFGNKENRTRGVR